MERIDSFFAPIFHQLPDHEGDKKKVKKQTPSRIPFSMRLEDLEADKSETAAGIGAAAEDDSDVSGMLDDIHGLGDLIKENPSMETLHRYKDAVRRFLRHVVARSFAVEKRNLTKFQVLQLRKGDKPELTVIKVIDDKLERLAAEIFRGQKEQLDIVHRVDEIYGLLVDLIR